MYYAFYIKICASKIIVHCLYNFVWFVRAKMHICRERAMPCQARPGQTTACHLFFSFSGLSLWELTTQSFVSFHFIRATTWSSCFFVCQCNAKNETNLYGNVCAMHRVHKLGNTQKKIHKHSSHPLNLYICWRLYLPNYNHKPFSLFAHIFYLFATKRWLI